MSNQPPIEVPQGAIRLNTDSQRLEFFAQDRWYEFATDSPTLDGGKTRVKVPAGIQSGKQLRLRGKGMPNIRGKSYGDLYIELHIETPVNLNGKQRSLLLEFEKSLEASDNSPKHSNFFSKVKNFWEKNSN